MLKPIVLLFSISIHLFIVMLQYPTKKDLKRHSSQSYSEQKITLKLSHKSIPSTIKEKKNPSKSKFTQGIHSMTQLRFSQKFHQEKSKEFAPNAIESLDPGGVKRSCLKAVLASSISFPDLIFQNQISGVARVYIILKDGKVTLHQRSNGHPILSKLLCYNLKNQFEKAKESNCLKQSEIRGLHKLSVTYSYGQKPFQKKEEGSRSYSYYLQRIKKKSPLRVIMAISNIFSLLELYQSKEAKAVDQTFLLNLERLNCRRLVITL